MKELAQIFFLLYYFFALGVAFLQGGFWWIFLNVFFPIAPMYVLAEKFLNL